MSNQIYYFFEIAAIRKSNNAAEVIKFSSRAVPEDLSYFPFLDDLPAIGVQQSEDLKAIPNSNPARIVISNSKDIVSKFHKVSDYLDSFILHNQKCFIFASETNGPANVVSGKQLVWQANIESYVYNVSNEQIVFTINTSIDNIRQPLNYVLNKDNIPLLPESNNGKSLPIVLGQNVQVKPISVGIAKVTGSNIALNIDRLAYATTLGNSTTTNSFQNAGIQKVLTKDLANFDKDQEYYRTVYPNNSLATATAYGRSSGAGINATKQLRNKWFFPLNYGNGTAQCIVDSGTIDIRTVGSNTAPSEGLEGEIVIGIHVSDQDYKPESRPIASYSVSKAELKAEYGFLYSNNNSNQTISFVLNTPVPIVWNVDPVTNKPDRIYFLSITASNEEPGTSNNTVIQTRPIAGGSFNRVWRIRSKSSNDNNEVVKSGLFSCPNFSLQNIKIEDAPNSANHLDSNGLSYSTATIKGNPAVFIPLAQLPFNANVDANKLDFIFEVNGIKDSPTGYLNGIPNDLLVDIGRISKLLFTKYSPGTNAFILQNIDPISCNNYSQATVTSGSGQYRRDVSGKSTGKDNVELLNEILTEHQVQLGYNGASATFFVAGYDLARSIVQRSTDYDHKILRYSESSIRNIVNFAQVVYNSVLDKTTGIEEFDLQQRFRQFKSTYQLKYQGSIDRYSIRKLAQESFNWVNDAQSIDSLIRLILNNKSEPSKFITLEQPYFKAKALKQYDVMTIESHQIPRAGGTGIELVNYEEIDCSEPVISTVRQNSLDARIISITHNYSNDKGATVSLLTEVIK